MKLLTEYENETQKVVFYIAVLAVLMSGNYVIHKNGDYLREINLCILVFRNKVRYQNATSFIELNRKRPTFR
jgi:hypothetical protein